MQVIRGQHNLRPCHLGCAATIGNFDGVHLGHRAVLRRLLAKGRELGLPATVITFEPQPMELFAPEAAPPRLTRLREKEFGPKLAAMGATVFVRDLLVSGLGTRYLLVGDDFRFGRGREGDYNLLESMGRQHGFLVEDLHAITVGDERVSSTRIRDALARGDLDLARHLLGRPYRICGRVSHGDKRGRSIGYPTANLNLHRRASPLRGVFAVLTHGVDDRPWPGVANLGTRPTVTGGKDCLLEVHLFDLAGELYGRRLEVEFRLKLRDERKFGSFTELKQQIGLDAAAARQFLGI
jgi:riboflavin kinase/FMN adenylyltransferase